MPSINHERRQKRYFNALANIIGEIKAAQAYFPTVLSVRLSNDRSHLFVYVTFEKNKQSGLAALQKAHGFVRSELATFMHERVTPEIHFELDESYETGQKIERILQEIKLKKT